MTDPTAAGAAINNTCPNCGYCPTCGRAHRPYFPPYIAPYSPPSVPWQQPYPWAPKITWAVNSTAAMPSGYMFNVRA